MTVSATYNEKFENHKVCVIIPTYNNEKSLAAVITDVAAYTNLSTFLFNMFAFEKAKLFNQKALEIAPNNPAANRIMANILLQDKNPNLALVHEYLSKTQNGVFW